MGDRERIKEVSLVRMDASTPGGGIPLEWLQDAYVDNIICHLAFKHFEIVSAVSSLFRYRVFSSGRVYVTCVLQRVSNEKNAKRKKIELPPVYDRCVVLKACNTPLNVLEFGGCVTNIPIPLSTERLQCSLECKRLPGVQLPVSIKHLELGDNFNSLISGVQLPKKLTHLKFGASFNQPVGDQLPETLTHLTFGCEFNQPVDHLPASITYIVFGSEFNQPVDQLPASITHIVFGSEFNQPVNQLPKTVTHMTVGYKFDQPPDQWPIKHVNRITEQWHHI